MAKAQQAVPPGHNRDAAPDHGQMRQGVSTGKRRRSERRRGEPARLAREKARRETPTANSAHADRRRAVEEPKAWRIAAMGL